MTFYDEMQAVATEVLTEFNQGKVEYVKVTPGNGPVDNPGAATQTKYTSKGAAVNGVSFKYVSMGLAAKSDLQAIVAIDANFQRDKALMLKDFIDVDGVRHKIVEIIPKPAAGTPAVNVFILRRGT